jgi:hypothetical protein
MFPILLKTDRDVGSKDSMYYIVASTGVYLVVDTEMYRAVTRCEGEIAGLLPERETLRLKFPPVPATILGPVLGFFRQVYEEHGGEGVVVLFYRPDTRTFRVGVPRQTIPGYRRWDGAWRAYLRLHYEHVERPPGYLRFGTIHSHAETSAYASHEDCEDEQGQDGLHVVYGHIHRADPSRSACFVANGARFELDPDDVVERCRVPAETSNPGWMSQVHREETGIVPTAGSLSGYGFVSSDRTPIPKKGFKR